MEVLVIEVRDTPQPQGSKRGFPVRRKDGRVGVNMASDNDANLTTWREAVKEAARKAMTAGEWKELQFPITELPVGMQVTFTKNKPKSAPKRRRTWPITKPDLDKLKRAVGDALTAAGVYKDDAQVVTSIEHKDYVGSSVPDILEVPGAVIRVWVIREEEQGG